MGGNEHVLVLFCLFTVMQSQSAIKTPRLIKVKTIVRDAEGATIRDPTPVVFDKPTNKWHFWATRVPPKHGTAGYAGRVWHYHSVTSDLEGSWNTSGQAVGTGPPGSFDAFGVFTPGALKDGGVWYLWFGGVPNGNRSHSENMGLATSQSAFGPWEKLPVPINNYTEVSWCDKSPPVRVDEMQGYYFAGGRKAVITKGVCKNFTALPGWWQPTGDGWNQPYVLNKAVSPLIMADRTAHNKGFENFKTFLGPDGHLHLTGHDHAGGQVPHFVSADGGQGLKWMFVEYITHFCEAPLEPAVVYPDGPPGVTGGIPTHFIQFAAPAPYHIDLMKVVWSEHRSP